MAKTVHSLKDLCDEIGIEYRGESTVAVTDSVDVGLFLSTFLVYTEGGGMISCSPSEIVAHVKSL